MRVGSHRTVAGKLTGLRDDGPFLTKIISAIRVAKVAELRECTSVGNGGWLVVRRDFDAFGRELACDPVGQHELAWGRYNALEHGQRQFFDRRTQEMIRTVGVKGSEPDHVRRAHPGQELLDVLYAGLLELGTPGWIV